MISDEVFSAELDKHLKAQGIAYRERNKLIIGALNKNMDRAAYLEYLQREYEYNKQELD